MVQGARLSTSSVVLSAYIKFESWIERCIAALLKHEPGWSKRHAYRNWFPIVILLSFVFVDNFRPADPRGRMQITPFEVDTRLTLLQLAYSLTKLNHMAFFFLLYLCLRRIWGLRHHGKIMAFVLAVSVCIEVQQGFTSGRDARPLDLLPNLLGTAAACYYLKDRIRRDRPWFGPS